MYAGHYRTIPKSAKSIFTLPVWTMEPRIITAINHTLHGSPGSFLVLVVFNISKRDRNSQVITCYKYSIISLILAYFISHFSLVLCPICLYCIVEHKVSYIIVTH